jgi:hypothetical protein
MRYFRPTHALSDILLAMDNMVYSGKVMLKATVVVSSSRRRLLGLGEIEFLVPLLPASIPSFHPPVRNNWPPALGMPNRCIFARSGHYPFVGKPKTFWNAVGRFLSLEGQEASVD